MASESFLLFIYINLLSCEKGMFKNKKYTCEKWKWTNAKKKNRKVKGSWLTYVTQITFDYVRWSCQQRDESYSGFNFSFSCETILLFVPTSWIVLPMPAYDCLSLSTVFSTKPKDYINIICLANSKKMLYNEEGIELENYLEHYNKKSENAKISGTDEIFHFCWPVHHEFLTMQCFKK